MKKIVFTVLVVLALGCTQKCLAQNCRAIVRPYYITQGIDSTMYPAEKEAYLCQFSQNAFFITQQVPQGVAVHDLDELTNVVTGMKAPKNMEIDLNTLSYWQYDFHRFTHSDNPRQRVITARHSSLYQTVRWRSPLRGPPKEPCPEWPRPNRRGALCAVSAYNEAPTEQVCWGLPESSDTYIFQPLGLSMHSSRSSPV